MQTPDYPDNEAIRLETLRALQLLDTPPEERFDRLTRLAQRLFHVPIALVTLVDFDRQWFKSCQGLAARETPRNISFCGHAILGDTPLVVSDTWLDARFCDNPLVLSEPYIRFYAGVPLRAANGQKIGTFCLIDRQPRELSSEDQESLQDLAHLAETALTAFQCATLDDLTLLLNRRGFRTFGLHTLSLCERLQQPVTLLLLDLNDFKAINDNYGHAVGDCVLVRMSRLLQATFRTSDLIGRLGGDEFVVLLSQADLAISTHFLARLDHALADPMTRTSLGSTLTYSVGMAVFDPQHPCSLDDLLAVADTRMYAHKQAQRKQCEKTLVKQLPLSE